MIEKIRQLIHKLFHTPVGKNIIANYYQVGVVFFNQILLVPLYIIYWGTEIYSDWIVLTAVSSFFTMSDLGLNSVTRNRVCMKWAGGDREECRSLLVNNYILILGMGAVILLLSLGGVFLFDFDKLLGLHVIDKSTASAVFVLLIVQIFLNMASTIMDSVYSANSVHSKGVYINNTARLINALIILTGIVCGLSLPMIVLLGLLPYMISLIYKQIDIAKRYDFKISLSDYNKPLLKSVIAPSIAFMSFPAGNYLIYQGFTLVVNKYFGANTLVLFNTTRTLVNFVRTMVDSITQGVKPELSVAWGKGDRQRVKSLHYRSLGASVLFASLLCVMLLIFGSFIYQIWTNGEIVFSYTLMLSFFVVVICNSFWNANSTILIAINKHSKIGVIYMVSAIVAISTAYLVSGSGIIELTALSIAVSDIIVSIYSYKIVNKVINS